MERLPEQTSHRLVFENLPPRRSSHESLHDPRESIQQLFASGELGSANTARVRFSEQGVSSVVAIIETEDNTVVVKMPCDNALTPVIEAECLRAWEQVGVSVPRVHKVGMIGTQPYLLQEYITTPTLEDVYRDNPQEMVSCGVYGDMGVLLRHMHVAQGEGYGTLRLDDDGALSAEHADFHSWIGSPRMSTMLSYTKERGLLSASHGSLEWALDVLREYNPPGTLSSYCHNDLTSDNVFATKPLTVFDPNPTRGDPLLDVAYTVMRLLSKTAHNAGVGQFCASYFAKDTFPQDAHMQAALLVAAYLQMPYLHKQGAEKRITAVQEYLAQR